MADTAVQASGLIDVILSNKNIEFSGQMTSYNDIGVPNSTLRTWQELLNLISLKFRVPAALIMKIELPDIKVFLSGESEGNPYSVGDSEHLFGSGLYCERVIGTKSKLLVPNALKNGEWNKNPDIEFGMISYMGFPIFWPNGDVFGTTCVLDSKENPYNEEYSNILLRFKQYIESYLDLTVSKYLREDRGIIEEKDLHCDELFLQIDKVINPKNF